MSERQRRNQIRKLRSNAEVKQKPGTGRVTEARRGNIFKKKKYHILQPCGRSSTIRKIGWI